MTLYNSSVITEIFTEARYFLQPDQLTTVIFISDIFKKLLEHVTAHRGPAHETHQHHAVTQKLWHNDRRTRLKLSSLVERYRTYAEVDLAVDKLKIVLRISNVV